MFYFTSVICPICHFSEEEGDEENGRSWVGCTVVDAHWWHRSCLSPLQMLLIDQDEEWACPLCQDRLTFVCDICLGSELCLSGSVNWITCTNCAKSYHSQCLSEGILTDALVIRNWECMQCVE